jgi:hypothetical protein
MQAPLIRTLSYHHREKYGFAVGKIPLDLGVRCPNRQKGGCIFCSAPGFSPRYLQEGGGILSQIERGKKHLLNNKISRYYAYFQQETPTTLEADRLIGVFTGVLADPECIGLIISTRPDCIQRNLLQGLVSLLHNTGKSCLFELGLQSAHDSSLKVLNRNHTFDDFLEGYGTLRNFDVFEVGVHLLLGIPGESWEDMIATVNTVCDLGVDALKIHHLQVLRDTPLQGMYERGEVQLFSRPDYQELLLTILPLIPEGVVIHRLWAVAHPDMLLAPKWNITATVLSGRLRKAMCERNIRQGRPRGPHGPHGPIS